jgi:hypothetical protein
LDRNVELRNIEGFEKDLHHFFSVCFRVHGGLSKEGSVLIGGDSELVEEGVMPDLLHIIPVVNDTVIDGILEGEDTSLGLSLISDVGFLLVHTDHDTFLLGSTDDGGET